MTGPVIELRRMVLEDLDLVRRWLAEPEVARWFLAGSTLEDELGDLGRAVNGQEPTEVLLASSGGRPVGWCQWYRCSDYPDHAAGVGAGPEDIGIDYAVGEPPDRGRGVGTALVATLIDHIRRLHRGAGVIADPEASNAASRRVLERNCFVLLDERVVLSEPDGKVMAIYRRPPEGR
ncbi:MAG: GNAT family N-acetyltransferase [Acidobacteriota bacterium]|nr:GNAT family N-acetyltransferase [Acidobacteriota bacterium]